MRLFTVFGELERQALGRSIHCVVLCLLSACSTQFVGPYVDLTDSELESRYGVAVSRKAPLFCDEVAPLAAERLRRDPANLDKQIDKYYGETCCAYADKRWDDAYASMLLWEDASDSSYGPTGLHISFVSKNYPDAIERLEAIAQDSESIVLLRMTSRYFVRFYRALREAERYDLLDRLVTAFSTSPLYPRLRERFRSELAHAHLNMQAMAGKFEGTGPLIGQVSSTSFMLKALASRSYEPLWPELERAAGPRLSNVSQRLVRLTSAEYRSTRTSVGAYEQAARARLYAGNFAGLVSFVETPAEGLLPAIVDDEARAL